RPLARRPRQVSAGRRGEGVARQRPAAPLPQPAARARDRRGQAETNRRRSPGDDRPCDGRGPQRPAARREARVYGRLGERRLGMAELTYRDAVAAAMAQEMRRDSNVVFLGEDVAAAGGVFKTTVGLLDEFG